MCSIRCPLPTQCLSCASNSRQQEVFRGLLTPLYTLLSLPWPLSDGQVDNGPVGGPSTHSPRKDKPDFLALRATAQKLLGFVESGLLARAFDGLSGVVNDRLYTKVDKGLLGGAPITSTDDIVSRLGALHQSFDDSLKEHMTNVETKLGVAEQARKQVTLVHASLVNAQEMVKEMRGDLDKNVTRGDLEAALNNALRMVPSVRLHSYSPALRCIKL